VIEAPKNYHRLKELSIDGDGTNPKTDYDIQPRTQLETFKYVGKTL